MNKIKTIILMGVVFVLSTILVGCGCQKQTTYTVTFDSNGGTKVAKQEVKENEKLKEPDDPTREGYNFKGWYLDGKKYDFGKKVTKDFKLKAKWSKVTEEEKDNDLSIDTILPKPVQTGNKNLNIDNIAEAKKEIKDFDVLTAKPVLQENAVNGKCAVVWENSETLNSIVRGLDDTKVELTAVVTCGSKVEKMKVTATIKKSPYTYSVTNKGVVSVIGIEGATNYTIKSDMTMAKYLDAASGAQVLTSLHNQGTNYTMWFSDSATKYIVKEGVI